MKYEPVTNHPIAKAIIENTAPRGAQVAAAKGVLPIPQIDLLEVLAVLANGNDAELAATARETFAAQAASDLIAAASSAETAAVVLQFAVQTRNFDRAVYEAVLTNQRTPDAAIADFAANTIDGNLLELVALNQQRLIRAPAILDAILANPHRTAEAARRAEETRVEFFEKSRGAAQIVEELRAQGREAAAQFVEQADFAQDLSEESASGKMSVDDAFVIARHIEVSDDEVDDSWLGFELIEQIYEESEEQRQALVEKIISETTLDGEAAPERIALIRRVLQMNIKDRIKLGMKGDREARGILIRDSNRVVAAAVMANPRITEQEVEKIAAMRTVPDDVLRTIGMNRTWARNYLIVHNLARNPRTPLPTAMNILPRIQTKDMKAISQNRNVSEAIRKQAVRLLAVRK